jgi:hypothetical protein
LSAHHRKILPRPTITSESNDLLQSNKTFSTK